MQLSVMSSFKQAMKLLSPSYCVSAADLLKKGMSWMLGLSILAASHVSAADVPAMDGFPRAELLEQTDVKNAEYRLIISGLKRKRAATSGEVERLITGDINRQFWQISTNHDVEQVMEYFLKQWQDEKILYRCKGLDCGSSNFWANDIFNNAKLYGRDKNQAYIVAMVPGSPNKLYVLYTVQRSKQKLYFNLDQVTTTDELTSDNVERENIEALLRKESGWLEGLVTTDGRIDEEKSEILLSTLRNLDNSIKRRLYLVVHCYEANNMADNFACSTRLAQQLRAATYDNFELPVFGHGALTLPPGNNLEPQLRFMLWPRRH